MFQISRQECKLWRPIIDSFREEFSLTLSVCVSHHVAHFKLIIPSAAFD